MPGLQQPGRLLHARDERGMSRASGIRSIGPMGAVHARTHTQDCKNPVVLDRLCEAAEVGRCITTVRWLAR
jgi:hypothetical protein